MGSLSFETNIRIKGTKNDKMQILSVLKEYEAGKKGIEFPDFRLQTTTNRAKLGDLDDVELRDFVDSCKQDTNGFDFTFENGQLSLHSTKNKKVISILTNPQLKAYFEFKKFVEEMNWHDTGEIKDEDAIAEEILAR